MKGRLPIEITTSPSAKVEQDFSKMLNTLAEALADRFIAQARAEVAKKLGVDEGRLHSRPPEIQLTETGVRI